MIPEVVQDRSLPEAMRRDISGEVLPNPPPREISRWFARPHYAERFRCIGGACEDTCCQGWGVPIDQGSYEKYRAHEAIKQYVGTLIVLNTSNPSRADYARMPLTAAGSCGFLDAQRMCGIQKQLGAEMLSDTCAVYPRAVATNAGQVEKALNVSCPEAARLVLLEADLLGVGGWGGPHGRHYAGLNGWDGARLRSGEVRLAVRQFALLLLGDRTYALWQRLYLLGNLVRRLHALSAGTPVETWCETHPPEVEHLLAESARIAAGERLRSVMDGIAGDPARQLELVAAILRLRLPGPPIPPRFVECLRDFESGIRCETASSEGDVLAAYADARRRFYAPLMERHPHLLENYLMNHVFKNNYPFGRKAIGHQTDVEAAHLSLSAHAALAQTMLIGMAGHYREAFSCDHVVKLVQSLAKTLEHSKYFLEQIVVFLREQKLDTPRQMALLLHQEG